MKDKWQHSSSLQYGADKAAVCLIIQKTSKGTAKIKIAIKIFDPHHKVLVTQKIHKD
jgi:hypothetical protein